MNVTIKNNNIINYFLFFEISSATTIEIRYHSNSNLKI